MSRSPACSLLRSRFGGPRFWMAALLCLPICAAGCGDAGDYDEYSAAKTRSPESSDGHAHPEHGPHEGDLIELGDEEYHAELVHDEQSGTVTIYILDGAAKSAVPIAATEVTINVGHEGSSEQFSLTARPDSADPDGKSSRFVTDVAALAEHLEHEEDTKRLVVEIEGKSFNGNIVHHHDHGAEGHEDHEDE